MRCRLVDALASRIEQCGARGVRSGHTAGLAVVVNGMLVTRVNIGPGDAAQKCIAVAVACVGCAAHRLIKVATCGTKSNCV